MDDSSDGIEISAVDILRLEPGDVIVFKHKGILRQIQQDQIKDKLEKIFPRHECLVLTEGAEISAIRP